MEVNKMGADLKHYRFVDRAARTHNKKINANFLFGALSLRMKVCALSNSCASYQGGNFLIDNLREMEEHFKKFIDRIGFYETSLFQIDTHLNEFVKFRRENLFLKTL